MLIEGLVVAAAGKKILDGYRKAGDAELIQRQAEESLGAVYDNYLREVERTVKSVDELNERKLETLQQEIARFVDSFGQIKNMDYQENMQFLENQMISFAQPDFQSLQQYSTSVWDYFHKGSKLNVAGQMVKNTLFIQSRARTLTNNALASLERSRAEQAKLNTEMEKCALLRTQAKQMNKILRKLVKLSRIPLAELESLVREKQDWRNFSVDEKKEVAATVKYMQMIKMLIEQPIVNEEGVYDQKADAVMSHPTVLALLEGDAAHTG